MIALDRRTALRGGIATVAGAMLPAPLLAADSRPILFIHDSRMPGAAAIARMWEARGVKVMDRQDIDLGHAWRGPIAAALREQQGPIAGLTLWMDSYICSSFGRDFGLTITRQPPGTAAPWQQWQLQQTDVSDEWL